MCSSFMLASVEMTLTRSAAPANKQWGHRHLGVKQCLPQKVFQRLWMAWVIHVRYSYRVNAIGS